MAVAVLPMMPAYIERQTLCIGGSAQGIATHAGEDDFSVQLRRIYQADENNATELLIRFKNDLARLDGEEFWSRLMTGMTEICHSQFCFVSKRVLFDDERTAIEMPRIGETGSCLMATAIYYNNGKDIKGSFSDYRYHAWSCPCSHMKHDKVFLVPEGLTEFVGPNNPNQVAFDCEAYLAVPLFADGKCFAHFGMMWAKDGIEKKRNLSWAFIEMFMHALEDMIIQKLLAGQTFAKPTEPETADQGRIIPHEAITATQSLKVYARSLSHELRTPMQGVVGMLDLMYATVQEQLEGANSNRIQTIFRALKENIEVVQDSSKRAIEAADNVVHAYDLNMQVPETPSDNQGTPSGGAAGGSYFDSKLSMLEGPRIVNTHKRKRSVDSNHDGRGAIKHQRLPGSPFRDETQPPSPRQTIIESDQISPKQLPPSSFSPIFAPKAISIPRPKVTTPLEFDNAASTPGFRQCNIREVIPVVINDSLRTGGRPDFAVTEPTTFGERIEVKSRSSSGHSSLKVVTWSVDSEVPEFVPIDERDLSKLIGAVFLNSLKFTDQGEIVLNVQLSASTQSILISVSDTGLGIPENFQPELFKPFSKEDGSITRTKEGLGLGLMVAKGLARRVGGDLNLVRTSTDGPDHGTEFEIRIPKEPCDTLSRATTPFRLNEDHSAPRSVPPATPTMSKPSHVTSPLMRELSPLEPISPSRINVTSQPVEKEQKFEEKIPITQPSNEVKPVFPRRISSTPKLTPKPDRHLAQKFPLSFLVAEDNKINRKLLVQMLNTLGYKDVHEAYDGKEAVRVMQRLVGQRKAKKRRNSVIPTKAAVDVILMDLWMPELDGYQATEQILQMFTPQTTNMDIDAPLAISGVPPTVLAVSADVTDAAIDKATKIGMIGYMSKPFKVLDLQKLILEFCVPRSYGPAVQAHV